MEVLGSPPQIRIGALTHLMKKLKSVILIFAAVVTQMSGLSHRHNQYLMIWRRAFSSRGLWLFTILPGLNVFLTNSVHGAEWITTRQRVKSEEIVPHYSSAARLLWVPSLSAVGLLCPLLVQMLHSHVDFHSEGWPWPILCQLEPIAHTASFTFFLCSSTEWQTPRPLGSPPPWWLALRPSVCG